MKQLKPERLFSISGNNRGLACPFTPIPCPNSSCAECPIYLDWQQRGEKVVICGWCGRVMRRNPDFGSSVLLLGICDDCELAEKCRKSREYSR